MSSPPAPASSAGKRGRRTSDPGEPVGWASLPPDLVRLVAWRLLADGDLLDYVRFRAVCTSWRSAAVCPRGRGVMDPRFHPRRWMMLPEGHCLYPGHPDLRGYARFLNLDKGALVRSRLPLLEDHLAIDSVDGLLPLLGDQYLQGTVRLLHPFTGDIVDLPPLATLLPQLEVTNSSFFSCPSKVLSTVRGDNVVCFHPIQGYLAHYHLSSGTWSRAIDDCSLYGRGQGPSSLVLYIYSCCPRTLWNRGIVYRTSPS